jgi:hypothetical protein
MSASNAIRPSEQMIAAVSPTAGRIRAAND